jgi:predicted nucleic acid-binding protein
VSEAWVVNASPLILFSRIRRLELIERLAPAILIPSAVIEDVRAGQPKDPTTATALEWAERYRVDDIAVVASIERWDLGLGESQVIAHSIGGSKWAVLDDLAARRTARATGLSNLARWYLRTFCVLLNDGPQSSEPIVVKLYRTLPFVPVNHHRAG